MSSLLHGLPGGDGPRGELTWETAVGPGGDQMAGCGCFVFKASLGYCRASELAYVVLDLPHLLHMPDVFASLFVPQNVGPGHQS